MSLQSWKFLTLFPPRSHVLEHATLGLLPQHVGAEAQHRSPLKQTLAEWHRVLAPGGSLLLSVPDLGALARFLGDATVTVVEKAALTRVLFGGQTDALDYHHVAFDADLLNATLNQAGFCDVDRVRSFGLFNDSSTIHFRDAPIALNVAARACRKRGKKIRVELPDVTFY